MYYQWCLFSDIILTYKKDDDEDEEGEPIGTNKKSSDAAKRKAFFNKMSEKGLEIERQKPQVARKFLLGCVYNFLHDCLVLRWSDLVHKSPCNFPST